MKKEITNKLAKDIELFLANQGWRVYSDKSDEYTIALGMYSLQEVPFPPKYLIEKQKQKMWVFYFWKGAYPIYRGKIQAQVTGIDWYKYDMIRGISSITQIPSAMIFDSEEQPEIIFRQVDQLPKPKHSFAPKKDPIAGFEYFKCWRENPERYRMLVKRAKFKFKTGMAVWEKANFGHDTFIQPKLV